MRGERAFSMADAVFEAVPDFIQAHFEEAPRLDNMHVGGRLLTSEIPQKDKKLSRRVKLHRKLKSRSYAYRRITNADYNMPARWRALKRLAIEGHDTDRELEFFSGEIRSARFAGDWPLPWPVWKAGAWSGFLRFWAGLLYQLLSNFGRSLLRPFFSWSLCIVIFAVFFLGQSPDLAEARCKLNHQGFVRQVAAYSTTAWIAASGKFATTCVSKTLPTGDPKEHSQNGFTGLAEPVRTQTNPVRSPGFRLPLWCGAVWQTERRPMPSCFATSMLWIRGTHAPTRSYPRPLTT